MRSAYRDRPFSRGITLTAVAPEPTRSVPGGQSRTVASLAKDWADRAPDQDLRIGLWWRLVSDLRVLDHVAVGHRARCAGVLEDQADEYSREDCECTCAEYQQGMQATRQMMMGGSGLPEGEVMRLLTCTSYCLADVMALDCELNLD